jgi:hypothetical protein
VSKKEFTPELVVVNPKLQRYSASDGKVFWKVELWFEANEGEQPENWQWDALLSPQRARLESLNALEQKELVRSGFVDPTAGPKCSTCLDLTFVLETISEQDLALVASYYNYVSKAWMIRNCPDCSANQDILEAERACNRVYHLSASARNAIYQENSPHYRVLYMPDPMTYSLPTWDASVVQLTQPALLVAGVDGCYADHMNSEKRDRNRRIWAERWKVTEVLEALAPKAALRMKKPSFSAYKETN